MVVFIKFIILVFFLIMEIKSDSEKIKFSNPWNGMEVNEGDGATVYRVIGINKVSDIDPFLMMDYFNDSKLPGGFPDHPHRGFETVTYLTQGKILHEDFKGHKGEIEEGDVQWMTAGRGIVHAEMPYSYTEPTSGFQLWINLSKENKMIEPNYQEIKNDKFPYVNIQNAKIKIIAGKIGEQEGACKSTTPTSFFDVFLQKGQTDVPINPNMSGFLFLFEGEKILINNSITLKKLSAIRFDTYDNISLKIQSDSNARFVIIFGKPLKEPIAKYGPFVMNTREELEQAFEDYNRAKNGFENRKTWKSEIQYLPELLKNEI